MRVQVHENPGNAGPVIHTIFIEPHSLDYSANVLGYALEHANMKRFIPSFYIVRPVRKMV